MKNEFQKRLAGFIGSLFQFSTMIFQLYTLFLFEGKMLNIIFSLMIW